MPCDTLVQDDNLQSFSRGLGFSGQLDKSQLQYSTKLTMSSSPSLAGTHS